MGKTSQDFYKNPDKYLFILEKKITKYNNSLDKTLLKKAYYFLFIRHLFQLRDSGDPYAYHPYEVAKILAELKFDITSIIDSRIFISGGGTAVSTVLSLLCFMFCFVLFTFDSDG